MELSSVILTQNQQNSTLFQYLDNFSKQQIENFYKKANDAYYNQKQEIIDDPLFDQLQSYISQKFQNSQVVKQIGALPKKNKVKLPYHLGSLNKLKNDKEVQNWLKKYNNPNSFVISDKLDGMSCLYYNDKLMTRGDSDYGQDISHMKQYIQGLPKNDLDLSIRGELIISKKDFENNLQKYFSNPRASIVGICNQKKTNQNQAKFITFIGYQIFENQLNIEQQFQLIQKNNFHCVHYTIVQKQKLTFDFLNDYLKDRKNKNEYEIDGIVLAHNQYYPIVTKDNPKHMVAWKTTNDKDTALTKVLSVRYNVSKDAVLIPTIQVEPVKIMGTTIQNVTGHNIDYIQKNGIGKNCEMIIFKAGEIIPSIKQVIKKVKPELPSDNIKWHYNETRKQAILDNPFENEEYNLKVVSNFFQVFKIPFIKEQTVTLLYNHGYNSIPKILQMSIDQFQQLPSFNKKKALKIYQSIHQIFDKPLDLTTLIVASNQFKRGFSVKSIYEILQNNPEIQSNLYNFNPQNVRMSDGKLKQQFILNYDNFVQFMKLNMFSYK